MRIKTAIDTLPLDARTAQLQAFSDLIEAALHDPAVLLDYREGCRKLADAIIAVDSKEYRSMFSQNKKESETLTEILGQSFDYLPPNAEDGVLVQPRR